MNAITYTFVRNNLAKTMDQVCADHAPVIVTRQNQQAVIMLSLEDYESLVETAYLLRSPKNAERLTKAIARLNASGGQVRELIE
jgi:antitoxin YefM